MYTPQYFKPQDEAQCIALMERHPFATVMTHDERGEPVINHFPMEVVKTSSGLSLIGHLSRKNPQLAHFQKGQRATVIFHGPQSYITPRWYAEHDVPTWNYAVVHASGLSRPIESYDEILGILRRLTGKFEPRTAEPNGFWRFSLPDDLKNDSDLTGAISGFEIRVSSLEGKFKLSQNRSRTDRDGVMAGLAERGDDMSEQMLNLMKEFKD